MDYERSPGAQLTTVQRLQSEAVRAFARVPQPLLSRVARALGGPPTNKAGDQLAPDVWLGLLAHSRLKHTPASAAASQSPADLTALVTAARRGLDIDALIFSERLEDTVIETELAIPREISAETASSAASTGFGGPLMAATRYTPAVSRGLLVYFHGGGWVVGSRASHAGVCRLLALEGLVDVVSVEYRLAPDHKFPSGVDDALTAWQWCTDRAFRDWGLPNGKRIVAGDSAGANLAAVVAQATRGRANAPTLQVLFYPATDLSVERESAHEFAEGFQLTLAQSRWYKRLYVRSEDDYKDVRASPLLADELAGVAPAHISVAGFDPLRDEGLAYADKLRRAGVRVTLYRAGSLIHGFVSLTAVSPDARAAAVDACGAIASA